MGREIKFRGKSIDNGAWAYFNVNGSYVDEGGSEVTPKRFTRDCGFKVDHETVGQFTGLRDKNGVEIYEGDVIKGIAADKQTISKGELSFQGCDYIVNFVEGNARGCYYLRHILLDSVEVIGNIYEHPHLLKGAESQ